MDIVEKFIRQISYKFPKGYIDMNNEQDVILLNSLLEDINQKNPQTFTQCKEILLNVVKLKKDIVDEIEKIYNANPNNQKSFLENFRKYSITDLDKILGIYKDYVNIIKTGLGRGEISILLGVKDSTSGGTKEKDIKIKDEVYDVKELSSGEFRTASSGYITNSSFQKHYTYLMYLLSIINKDNTSTNIEEKKSSKKNINTIQDQIQFLTNYYDNEYKAGNISGTVIEMIYSILPELKSYTKSEGDIEEKPYIKIGNKKYEIDSVITNDDGTPESVKLGLEVKEQKALISKLLKHPWVVNPKLVYEDLNQIWLDYLSKINGLIIYDGGKLNLYNTSELQKEFEPYRILQNQLNIAKKETKSSSDKKKD